MTAKLPYMLSPTMLTKVFEKIQEAKRPPRFTQDFLANKLGQTSGHAKAIIPLLKKMGFLGSDGSPTLRYDQFRNHTTQGLAIASGMKEAFSELFDRSEYAYELSKDKLTGLVTEITGAAKDERTTQATVSTFFALNELADFEFEVDETEPAPQIDAAPQMLSKNSDLGRKLINGIPKTI